MVIKVCKSLNTPLHNKYLCKIMAVEVGEYRVEGFKPPFTSIDDLIEGPKQPIKPNILKYKEEIKNASVKKDANLESKHSRSQKRVRRWASSRRKRLKEYD